MTLSTLDVQQVPSQETSAGKFSPRVHLSGSRSACFVYFSRKQHPRQLWSPCSSLAAHSIRVNVSGSRRLP